MLLSANSNWTSRLSSQWQRQPSPFLQESHLNLSLEDMAAGWNHRDQYAPREPAQRSTSYQSKYPSTNHGVPSSSSWESQHPSAGHTSSTSSTYHPSSTEFGNHSFSNEHHRSASGPASTSSNRQYGTSPPSTVPYTSGPSSQLLSPSQHYNQQQQGPYPPSTSTAGVPPVVSSSQAQHPSMQQEAIHHGYSSTAPPPPPPTTAAYYDQQQSQHHPFHHPSAPSGVSAPYQTQHPHYYPQGYPNTSPSFSDHHEFHPQLNPFEVKHRRRTTRSQFKLLEATFRDNPKPNAAVRKEISEQLEMPIRAVQIWFQNRRAKAKAVSKRGGGGGGGGGDSGRSNRSADGSLHDSDADVSRGNISMDARSISYDNKDDAMYSSHHHHHHHHHHGHSRSYSSNHDINGSANLSSSSSGSGFNSNAPPAHQSQSNSFKMPLRPSRLELDPPSRRLTTNSMPTSASSSSFIYHSPTFASAPSSASYDESSFSHRPMTSSSAPYDDRYRGNRGPLTSPSVLSRESSSSMQFDRSGPYSQPPSTTTQHMNHTAQDVEGRRPSLPDNALYQPLPTSLPATNIPSQQAYHPGPHRSHYTEGNYSHHQQSSHPQGHPQGEYWKY